jgi:hypothetical protein
MHHLKSPLYVSVLIRWIYTQKTTLELVHVCLYNDIIGLDPFHNVLQPVTQHSKTTELTEYYYHILKYTKNTYLGRMCWVTCTYLLTPWHYSPDGHKPLLIRFHSLRNRSGNLADTASHSCCVGFFYMP